MEPSIIKHGQDKGKNPAGWKRPFLETESVNREIPSKPVTETVEFPEKDESVGEVVLNFLGPPPNAFVERKVSTGRTLLNMSFNETKLRLWI